MLLTVSNKALYILLWCKSIFYIVDSPFVFSINLKYIFYMSCNVFFNTFKVF